jgi:hypothetical protein
MGGRSSILGYRYDEWLADQLAFMTMWMDRRIQWNGAIYQEDRDHT